ncbi:MAG: dihydroorotase [Saprospiraceae bacterium]|nr:MAG: dihydroorotase [Saprospiraceae bacterium]
MNWLIKNATILDPQSSHHKQVIDLLIKNGKIDQIGQGLSDPKAKVIEAGKAFLSPGWMDVGVQTGEPGFEHRETLESVAAAAARGGYTAIASYPNTHPVIHSKPEVFYLLRKTQDSLVDFHPIGAISQDCAGIDITEMIDMHHAGAVAFSDGNHSLQHAGLMMRALLYVKAFGGLVMNQPQDHTIAGKGQMNEGLNSLTLGLKGLPALAEEIMVQRDLFLAEYTNSRLHITNVSSARSVELIREAKAKGLDVTASVAVMNLVFDDEELLNFDTNYKVSPPLREAKDREALLAGLKDGTIDLINSNHVPLEQEVKDLEFPYAAFGVIGLETAYAAISQLLSTEELVEKLALAPRRIFDLPVPKIEVGGLANLTLFDPEAEWSITADQLQSLSRNSPFLEKSLRGKVIAVFNKGLKI